MRILFKANFLTNFFIASLNYNVILVEIYKITNIDQY